MKVANAHDDLQGGGDVVLSEGVSLLYDWVFG